MATDEVFTPLNSSDGVSRQDLYMASLTPSQRRAFQQMAMDRARQNGRFSRSHHRDQQALIDELHTGERINRQSLQRLIKEARHLSGVNAGEMLDLSLIHI